MTGKGKGIKGFSWAFKKKTDTEMLLVLWAAVFACTWAAGSLLLSDLPFSAFYLFPLARLEHEAHVRRVEAERYFISPVERAKVIAQRATLLDGTPRFDARYVDTCIAVLRDERSYFLPTMHSLLNAMQGEERDNVHVVVVNTATQPHRGKYHRDRYVSAEDESNMMGDSTTNGTARDVDLVRLFVDAVIDPNVSSSKSNIFHDEHLRHSWEQQELQDYATALRYCERTMTKSDSMTMVLEDDIIVSNGFLGYFWELCTKEDCSVGQQLGSVKLFTTEYYWGWETKEAVWLALTGLSVASLSVFILLCAKALCRDKRPAKNKSKKNKAVPVSLITLIMTTRCRHLRLSAIRLGGWQYVILHSGMAGIFFICALLAIGRQNVFPPYVGRDGIWQFPAKTIDSNTVATVFDTRRVGELATLMEIASRRSKFDFADSGETDLALFRPVDLLIDNWCKSKRLKRMYVVPSLVQHVGLWSSSDRKRRLQRHVHRYELGLLQKTSTPQYLRQWRDMMPWQFKMSMSFKASVR